MNERAAETLKVVAQRGDPDQLHVPEVGGRHLAAGVRLPEAELGQCSESRGSWTTFLRDRAPLLVGFVGGMNALAGR